MLRLDQIILQLCQWRQMSSLRSDPEVTLTFEDEGQCQRACVRLSSEFRELTRHLADPVPHVLPDRPIKVCQVTVTLSWKKPRVAPPLRQSSGLWSGDDLPGARV